MVVDDDDDDNDNHNDDDDDDEKCILCLQVPSLCVHMPSSSLMFQYPSFPALQAVSLACK